jgi:hypothetical protein
MVVAIEQGVVGIPGVVLLDFEHCPSQSLLIQPWAKFSKSHFGKSVFGVHELICKSENYNF